MFIEDLTAMNIVALWKITVSTVITIFIFCFHMYFVAEKLFEKKMYLYILYPSCSIEINISNVYGVLLSKIMLFSPFLLHSL